MGSSKSFNTLYLCNYDDQYFDSGDQNIKNLWCGQWKIANTEVCKQILATGLQTEALLDYFRLLPDNSLLMEEILCQAISAFLKFMNHNWEPHPQELKLEEFFGLDWPDTIDVHTLLQSDSEPLFINILYPELLYFSSQLFEALYRYEQNLLSLWWCFRCKVTHQRALEDTSATLYSELEKIMAQIFNELQNSELLLSKPRLRILLYAEMSQAYLVYGRVQKSEEYLAKARNIAGLKLELTGILGKRTKFQQQELPQLTLSSELDGSMERPSAEDSHGASQLPSDIALQDDVRLNRIQFSEEVKQTELPSLEQTICLLTIHYLQKAQPKDALLAEELMPYIELVLAQQKGPWATRVGALLARCRLEADHRRTVERAMLQCETIVNDSSHVAPTQRLSYIWASGLPPSWCWRQQLADLYLSLGLVKAALELYLALQLWEDVIVCYTALQLRHKAAEVIQQQIDIKPTVKLYCLLGDATDDVACYEKAWEFSQHKSSRAQRHWGNFLFNHKQYEECIPHFERSLEINSIQERVWLRLAYAALETEQWETSAKAYRRYTYLQPNTFEAWNNLAKVYVKQGDKGRAYRALMEALKFNYDNWKLWENVIMISMDTGHFEDAIRGAHRVLDLQHKFDDAEVLSLLVRAVVEDLKDAEGNSAARLRKRVLELFGRVTSTHQNKPELWQLYAEVSPTALLRAQRLLKAYRGYTLSGNWCSNPETCRKVIDLSVTLLRHSLKARQEAEDKDKIQADQQLSSARLTGQAVLRAAEKQNWPETTEVLAELKTLFEDVTDYMKSIM